MVNKAIHKMSKITEIIFEDICEGYGYGMYGDFKIIMMRKNGYVNASKLCREHNKKYDHWSRNDNSNELINVVKQRIQQKNLIPHYWGIKKNEEFEPIIIIKGGGEINKISGTYVHPLLIPHVASWISPEFGIKVSEIVNEHVIIEYKNQLLEKERENISLTNRVDILLKKIDEQTKKIDEQSQKMDEQSQKMDERTIQMTEQNNKIIKQNKKMSKETKILKKQNNKQIKQLSELQLTVSKISQKLVECAHIPDKDELADRFVVIKSSNDYYVIRAQERNIYNAIKRQEQKGYRRINDLIESETIPNSIYLWNTIKDELTKEKKMETNRNNFVLKMSEQDFITLVKLIFDQRKNYN